MKKCPTCSRTYADETLSFCLEDGALLTPAFDSKETLVLGIDDPTVRKTNPDYDAERPTETRFTRPKETSSSVRDIPTTKTSPHLIFAGAGLLAVIVFVAGLIYMSSVRANDGASQGTPRVGTIPNSASSTPVPQPTLFRQEVTIPSTQMWYDTGIDVAAGGSVKVEYRSGQWTNGVGANLVDGQGKQFGRRDLLIVPSSYMCALVGKVGNNSFHVGNFYFGTPGKGRLYLSMNDTNDQPGTYADNGGSLNVLVELNGIATAVSDDKKGNIPTTRQLQEELLKEAKRIEDAANR